MYFHSFVFSLSSIVKVLPAFHFLLQPLIAFLLFITLYFHSLLMLKSDLLFIPFSKPSFSSFHSLVSHHCRLFSHQVLYYVLQAGSSLLDASCQSGWLAGWLGEVTSRRNGEYFRGFLFIISSEVLFHLLSMRIRPYLLKF